MTEEQLIRQATDALIDNLGIMEATRFLTLDTKAAWNPWNGINYGKAGWIKKGSLTRFLARETANKPE